MPTDVTGHFLDNSTLVAIYIDTNKGQGPEGFIRVDTYSVTNHPGPLRWQPWQRRTLSLLDGGDVNGGKCVIGVCAEGGALSLSGVISFYRAPGEGSGPESPFDGPNPRRHDGRMPCTHRVIGGGPLGKDAFFYPLMDVDLSGGIIPAPFKNRGNYFYGVCVRQIGTDTFYICDPEMEIGP